MNLEEENLLELELNLLEEANRTLKYSYQVCSEIGIKEEYNLEELDKFEALTSRFARTSDIVIQKIFRLIDIIELEKPGSIIDRINRMEKREIIESAESFKDIRRLRNDIAHEYIPEAIEEIFKNVLKSTPELIEVIEKIMKKYKD